MRKLHTTRLTLCATLFLFIHTACSNAPLQASPELSESLNPDFASSHAADESARFRPMISTRGMVVSDDRIASEWGTEILKRGGNAVDAAVATAMMLAVTRPHYASLGGGGFFLYCPKSKNSTPSQCQTIDYRERAGRRAHRDMYIVDGKARTDLSQDHALSSGTPGVVAGLLTALKEWGTLSREVVLEKPRDLAHRGFPLSSHTERAARSRWKAMNSAAKKLLACEQNKSNPSAPCTAGALFRQRDLGRVLDEISLKGIPGFYQGWVADKIVSELKKEGGVLELEDFANYSIRLRTPLETTFAGMNVVTMPPPSAGGSTLIQMLQYSQMAEKEGAFKAGFGSVSHLHAMAHSMILAYQDRARFYGDPDFVNVPTKEILSDAYLAKRFHESYRTDKMNVPEFVESHETTHFSVIDAEGNAVAVTTTVNDNFGSAQVPAGTGIFMNNEMDDFAIQPGTANLFGLIQGERNAITPLKRPLSSMTPTIVRDMNGNNRLVLGAAGGPRITTSVFQTLVNRYLFGMAITDAVNAPRIHHQWKPDTLMTERFGFAPEVRTGLKNLGYTLKSISESARMHVLERFPTDGRVLGAPDRRAEGDSARE